MARELSPMCRHAPPPGPLPRQAANGLKAAALLAATAPSNNVKCATGSGGGGSLCAASPQLKAAPDAVLNMTAAPAEFDARNPAHTGGVSAAVLEVGRAGLGRARRVPLAPPLPWSIVLRTRCAPHLIDPGFGEGFRRRRRCPRPLCLTHLHPRPAPHPRPPARRTTRAAAARASRLRSPPPPRQPWRWRCGGTRRRSAPRICTFAPARGRTAAVRTGGGWRMPCRSGQGWAAPTYGEGRVTRWSAGGGLVTRPSY
jgi:hypothetical protein